LGDNHRVAIETEIKFRVADVGALEARLKQLGFRVETPRTAEHNEVFDTPSGRLRRAGELLRLRQYGGRVMLTFKGKRSKGRHKARPEFEVQVGDAAAMRELLGRLGYRVAWVYEKFRAEYSDGTGHVVLDETPIGNIAEIEGPAGWIDATAKKLGVTREQYVTESYAELFAEWKRRTRSKMKDMTWALHH